MTQYHNGMHNIKFPAELHSLYSSQNTKTELLILGSRNIREGMETDKEYWSEKLEGRELLHVERWQVLNGSYGDSVVVTEQTYAYVTQDRVR
jgi:hypothetical protein